eukprot:GHVL01024239.1.p1 GENE.GHVL01024239.1~~GHVL01024239.1.p1  ORF type:complete len:133 (+),score=6.88 GHVL01024239.1:44-400(+)
MQFKFLLLLKLSLFVRSEICNSTELQTTPCGSPQPVNCHNGFCPSVADAQTSCVCLCQGGFGSDPALIPNNQCTLEVSPCNSATNPCANSGQCVAITNDPFFRCDCASGWEGATCESG